MTNPSPPTQHETFHIPALDCPEETALIEKGLGRMPGLLALRPNYAYRELQVEFDPGQLDWQTVEKQLAEIGFPGERRGEDQLPSEPATAGPRTSTIIGGLLLAAAAASYFVVGPRADVTLGLLVASTIASGLYVVRRALRAVRLRSLDMNVLMSTAAAGALATGNETEAAAAMFLFGVSLWLESFSLNRARRSLRSLLELTPTVAHRIENGNSFHEQANGQALGALEYRNVDPKEIAAGDRLLVKPGERIAVDGNVMSGQSSVDQAPITGESLPIDKAAGDGVFAGSLNGEGVLLIEATETAGRSTLAHIGRLVREAQTSRAATERFVDQFARRYTPAVLLLAAIIGLGPGLLIAAGVEWTWLGSAETIEWWHRGLVLLVIACPCALVISTPLTIVCGLYQGTRLGLLVKGGEALEDAGRIEAVLFDKTGTLTTGNAVIVAISTYGSHDENELLQIAAALESQSEHPLAKAITDEAKKRGLPVPLATGVNAIRGFGIEGQVDSVGCMLGNRKLFQGEREPADSRVFEQSSFTGVATIAWVARDGQIIGAIHFADTLRDDAAEAITALKRLGIKGIGMLTGDRREVAEHIAAQAGIDLVFADLLPEQKVEAVKQLAERFGKVAMVGDGVNDAPALAASHLGIAMGRGASATAAETAGVLVTSPRVGRVADLIVLGRRCRRLLWQNITLALAIKAITLVLAAFGLATMWMAVAADVGATMVVIFNGMRMIDNRRRPD